MGLNGDQRSCSPIESAHVRGWEAHQSQLETACARLVAETCVLKKALRNRGVLEIEAYCYTDFTKVNSKNSLYLLCFSSFSDATDEVSGGVL